MTSYQSTMAYDVTVMDIFHDIYYQPVDKASIVTARGSTVVPGPAVSKYKISK
jgi:hypothetical protein